MGRCFLILLLAITLNVWAETTVYKRERADGTVEFSDSPFPGGTELQVPEVMTYESPARKTPPQNAAPEPTPTPKPQISYEAIQVTAPGDKTTVFFDTGGLPVAVNVQPSLQPGHVVAIFLDGQLAAKGPQSSFTLKGVHRGSHTIAAAILDSSGTELVSSNPVSFQMIQHTKRP